MFEVDKFILIIFALFKITPTLHRIFGLLPVSHER